MYETYIIDGNNLLHAVRMLGPQRTPGRETLLRIIEHWAASSNHNVTLVFDGPTPRGPFGQQMRSGQVAVVFSELRTADDCIVERLDQLPRGGSIIVVSDDTAIQYEARVRAFQIVPTTVFIALLFPGDPVATPKDSTAGAGLGPTPTSEAQRDDWLDVFDDGKSDEPFDGSDAMEH